MRIYYLFQSGSDPELQGFTDDPTGDKLPAENRPWTFVRQVSPDEEWTHDASRAVVVQGIAENGFALWGRGTPSRPTSSRSIIESDRVEGTAVFDADGTQIGTIKRLLIEKMSGRVVHADVTFGGFLGIGVHHRTIPWEQLAYDPALGGYRTGMTEEQAQSSPTFQPPT